MISSAATVLMGCYTMSILRDNQNGLVVGDNGLMLVTTDGGGTTWKKNGG